MPEKIDQGEQIQGERKMRGRDKKPRAKSRTLTDAEFEAVRPFLRITPDRIEAARLAMVHGERLVDIADKFGWKTRQSVSTAVSNVWEAHLKYEEGIEQAEQLRKKKRTPKAQNDQ